jgi:hypothetical protein
VREILFSRTLPRDYIPTVILWSVMIATTSVVFGGCLTIALDALFGIPLEDGLLLAALVAAGMCWFVFVIFVRFRHYHALKIGLGAVMVLAAFEYAGKLDLALAPSTIASLRAFAVAFGMFLIVKNFSEGPAH